MQSDISHFILQYRYIAIIPGALFEGPFVMLLSGFFVKLGYLELLPAYLLLMAGDLLGDVAWYGVGYHWGEWFIRRWGRYFSITDAGVTALKRLFHRYHYSILLVSKMTMGFGFALGTLVMAGIAKIPFRRYFALNFFGQFIWTGILVGVGFSLGSAYSVVDSVLGKVFVVAFLFVIFFTLVGFGTYVRGRMLKANSQ